MANGQANWAGNAANGGGAGSASRKTPHRTNWPSPGSSRRTATRTGSRRKRRHHAAVQSRLSPGLPCGQPLAKDGPFQRQNQCRCGRHVGLGQQRQREKPQHDGPAPSRLSPCAHPKIRQQTRKKEHLGQQQVAGADVIHRHPGHRVDGEDRRRQGHPVGPNPLSAMSATRRRPAAPRRKRNTSTAAAPQGDVPSAEPGRILIRQGVTERQG